MGQVLTETQPSGGGTTTYAYDEAGRLVSLEDPDDNITTYSYNGANEVVTEESPTGGLTTMTYDLDGDVLSTVDPDGHEITYSYDADNEVTGETWVNPAGGTPLDVFDYTYNADGELTAVSDDNSAYQYTYNADGEETSQARRRLARLADGDFDLRLRRRRQPHQHGRQPGRPGQLHVRRPRRIDQRDALRLGHLGDGRGEHLRQRRQHDRPDAVLESSPRPTWSQRHRTRTTMPSK